jgi:hypothetical protein
MTERLQQRQQYILSVQINARLRWKKYVQQTVQKKTWHLRLFMHHSLHIRIIHKAISSSLHSSDSISYALQLADVRSARQWCLISVTHQITEVSTESLSSQSNESLQENLTAALKQKSNVMSVNLHMKQKTMQRFLKTASHSVAAKIS